MNVPEVAEALAWLECDPELLGSMVRLGQSIEDLRGRIKHCEACGSHTLGLGPEEWRGHAAALVEFVARLQARGPKARRGVRHEARR